MTRPPFPVFFIASARALSVLGDATMYAVLPSYYVHIGHNVPDFPIPSDVMPKGLQYGLDTGLKIIIMLCYQFDKNN
jgi:hypothetical protein